MLIDDDMMSSISLDASYRVAYVSYIGVGRMVIKYEGVLTLPTVPEKDEPVAKTLGITLVDV